MRIVGGKILIRDIKSGVTEMSHTHTSVTVTMSDVVLAAVQHKFISLVDYNVVAKT